jgi:hypothetical protein
VEIMHKMSLDIVRRLSYVLKTQRFGDWICLRHLVKVRRKEAPSLVGPLDRARSSDGD